MFPGCSASSNHVSQAPPPGVPHVSLVTCPQALLCGEHEPQTQTPDLMTIHMVTKIQR